MDKIKRLGKIRSLTYQPQKCLYCAFVKETSVAQMANDKGKNANAPVKTPHQRTSIDGAGSKTPNKNDQDTPASNDHSPLEDTFKCKKGTIVDCILSRIHESAADKEATNPELETRAERNECSNSITHSFITLCNSSKNIF